MERLLISFPWTYILYLTHEVSGSVVRFSLRIMLLQDKTETDVEYLMFGIH